MTYEDHMKKHGGVHYPAPAEPADAEEGDDFPKDEFPLAQYWDWRNGLGHVSQLQHARWAWARRGEEADEELCVNLCAVIEEKHAAEAARDALKLAYSGSTDWRALAAERYEKLTRSEAARDAALEERDEAQAARDKERKAYVRYEGEQHVAHLESLHAAEAACDAALERVKELEARDD